MNILVYGGWFGSGNLGDEAILMGVNEVLGKKIPDATLTALSIDPEYTYLHTGIRAESIESPRTFLRNRERYLKLFKDADAHLLTGGTPFYDYGHLSRIIHMSLPALSQRKVFCFGVGSKPIKTLRGREITRMLLKNTAIISTRDLISKEILQPLSGRIIKPITVTGDSAMMLSPVAARRSGDHILFCPRRLEEEHRKLYHQELDRAVINRIRHMQALTADRLIDEGYKVSFMPFHTVSPDDDREEVRRIRNLMHSEADVLHRPTSIRSALETLGGATLVVGLRLHSLILASLQATLFVSVDYDIKMRGYMEHMKATEYIAEINQGLERLYEKTRQALDNQEKYSLSLGRRVNAVRGSINTEADRLVSVLNQRNSGSRRI